MGFPEQLDMTYLVHGEKRPGRGEDSFCTLVTPRAALAAVFDGCGGAGAQTYRRFQGHSGAYVASRLLSGAVCDWFYDHGQEPAPSAEALCGSLGDYFSRALRLGAQYTAGSSTILGGMMRTLPTTAAIALAHPSPEGILLDVLWAGDSRVYLLEPQGLAQLTRDDARVTDAFENLYASSPMNNLLSASEPWTLHHRRMVLSTPALFFASTDGCFGCWSTPMEFEALLLEALGTAASPAQFEQRLQDRLAPAAEDDFALAGMSFLFGDYPALGRAFAPRAHELEQRYLSQIPEEDETEIRARLWSRYRTGYLRYQSNRG